MKSFIWATVSTTLLVCVLFYEKAVAEPPKAALPTYEQGYLAGYNAALGKWRGAGICVYANLACKIEVR